MLNFNFDGEECIFYQISDLTDEMLYMNPKYIVSEPNRKKDKRDFYDVWNTFDIETTTVNKIGYMYAFMFNFNGINILGRRWEEFKEFIDRVRNVNKQDATIVFYVHNLSFEFQFIKDFVSAETVFASKAHKVIKFCTSRNIEFRCSYMLSNMSLDRFLKQGKNVKHFKQSGEKFDYKKLRTPETELSEEELCYMYSDVQGLNERLQDYRDEFDIADIPLTSTSFVRKDCRNAMNNPNCRKWFERGIIGEKIYTMIKEEMRGGNTHGCYKNSRMIIENVCSVDKVSSYPFQMLTQRYPVGQFMEYEVDSVEELEEVMSEMAVLFRVCLQDVELKNNVPVPYLSESKMLFKEGVDTFNGRVIRAKQLVMTLNEVDYKIVKSQYKYKNIGISDIYVADKAMLPDELRNVIKDYYYKKCTLKNDDYYLYMKSKNKLNGIFGMTCTDIVRGEWTINDEGEWEESEPNIAKAIEKYNTSNSSFLLYQVGAWVTAYARKELQDVLDITAMNTIYCDTDSDKYISTPEIEAKIDELNKEIEARAMKHGAYVDYNGKRYVMGVLEHETDEKGRNYRYFKTLGAKRYAYAYGEEKEDFHITVSGVDKEKGRQEIIERSKNLLDCFKIFDDGLVLYKAGKTTAYYNNFPPKYVELDGVRMLQGSNVGLENQETCSLYLAENYVHFLENFFEYFEEE